MVVVLVFSIEEGKGRKGRLMEFVWRRKRYGGMRFSFFLSAFQVEGYECWGFGFKGGSEGVGGYSCKGWIG